VLFFFSSRRRHTRSKRDWSSDVCSSDLDCVYKTVNGKLRAVVAQVEECHAKGQPVLVGTISVEKSEALSRMLKAKGIPHNVLNRSEERRVGKEARTRRPPYRRIEQEETT